MDMFTTRTMLPMMKTEFRAKSFLRDRYFSNVRTFDTTKLDIDIVGPNSRRMAPFVNPKVGGKALERKGFKVESYEAPELSPDMVTTAEDLLHRSPGENIYNAKSPNARAAEQLGYDLAELDDVITRREEWMCAQALFTGKIEIKGEGYDHELNYWSANEDEQPVTTPATLWTADGCDPLADFRAIRRGMIKDAGVTPVECLMGTNALEVFLHQMEKRNAILDYRRVDMGQIDPQHLPNGVTYWGYFKDSALDIFTYDEWYLDDDGTEKPMVPLDDVLVAGRGVRTTMAYGLVALFDRVKNMPEFHAEARVPHSWVQEKNPAGRIVQVKSRPLPIVHQTHGFHVVKPI